VVIGDSVNLASGTDTPAAASWNGTRFTDLKAPQLTGASDAAFEAVSCVPPHSIAVGAHGTAKTAAPAALGWNGAKWTMIKVPGPAAGKAAVFASVSCPVYGRCVAAGEGGTAGAANGLVTPIAGYWNGRTWTWRPMFP
jgi:hypothetical protein